MRFPGPGSVISGRLRRTSAWLSVECAPRPPVLGHLPTCAQSAPRATCCPLARLVPSPSSRTGNVCGVREWLYVAGFRNDASGGAHAGRRRGSVVGRLRRWCPSARSHQHTETQGRRRSPVLRWMLRATGAPGHPRARHGLKVAPPALATSCHLSPPLAWLPQPAWPPSLFLPQSSLVLPAPSPLSRSTASSSPLAPPLPR